MQVLIVDAANVVGSRPDGWWRDRAGAARRLHRAVAEWLRRGTGSAASASPGESVHAGSVDRVVLVLEGRARGGVATASQDPLVVVHASGEGDDEIVAQAAHYLHGGHDVHVVTADRGLRRRVLALTNATDGATSYASTDGATSHAIAGSGSTDVTGGATVRCLRPSWLLARVDPAS